ncbi:MAG: hypothetical protein GC159_11760 [Phycisphaera sp.]|nr:hypothetical protein [Phycisphaera sp.]
MLTDDTRQIGLVIERLREALDDLTVRGLRACGGEQLASLRTTRDELAGAGATHLAQSLTRVIDAITSDDDDGPAHLMRAQATLRLFDRLLTLDVAKHACAAMADTTRGGDA